MAVHGPAHSTFPVKPPSFFRDLPLSEPSRWAISATAPPRHQRRDLLGALAAGISLLIPKMQVPEPCTRARNNLGAADPAGTHWGPGTRRRRAHSCDAPRSIIPFVPPLLPC